MTKKNFVKGTFVFEGPVTSTNSNFGFWNKTGTTLSPLTANDKLDMCSSVTTYENLVLTGTSTTTINYGNDGAYAYGYENGCKVFGYKVIGGVRYYSSNSLDSTATDNSSSSKYNLTFSWTDQGSAVDGYRVFISMPYMGFPDYGWYYETTGTTFDFPGVGTEVGGVDTATPTSIDVYDVSPIFKASFMEAGQITWNNLQYPYVGRIVGDTGITGDLDVTGDCTVTGTLSPGLISLTGGYEIYGLSESTSRNTTCVFGKDILENYTTIVDTVAIGSSCGTGTGNCNWSVLIGNKAGLGANQTLSDVFIGDNAGNGAYDCFSSNFIGWKSGLDAYNADNCQFIGAGAGKDAFNSTGCFFVGSNAGQFQSNSTNTIFIGDSAGIAGSDSNYCIGLGSSTFKNSIIMDNCIALGRFSGAQLTGYSNKLIISSTTSSLGTSAPTLALVYGNFNPAGSTSGQYLRVNGDLQLYDNLKIQLGNTQDAEIYYNNTDLIINPKIGTGTGQVLIGASGNADMKLNTIEIDGTLNHDGSNIGFFGVTPTTRQTELTDELTTITHTAPTTPDYAIQDLTDSSPFGFATKDEGNSVLAVIANLQTRVNELETKLTAYGLLQDAD